MKTNNAFTGRMIALLAFIFLSTSVMAGLPAKPWATHNRNIQETIAQTIKFPDNCFTKGHNGETAEITFILTENGKIEVKSVNCNCKEMVECIKNQLSDVYCPEAMHPYNQHYKIKVTFQNS